MHAMHAMHAPQATMAGLVIGFFLYYRNLIYYWNYNVTWRCSKHLAGCTNTVLAVELSGYQPIHLPYSNLSLNTSEDVLQG